VHNNKVVTEIPKQGEALVAVIPLSKSRIKTVKITVKIPSDQSSSLVHGSIPLTTKSSIVSLSSNT
jgi:hypothetical protein